MCEMLGFSSPKNENITYYLKELYSHSPQHPNGWGLAQFESGSLTVHTEPVSALSSRILPKLLEDAAPSNVVLAHIRRATVGGVGPLNCHPFIRQDENGRRWVLMHNGTVFSGVEMLAYREKQMGNTDSERILLYLLDNINEEAKQKGCALNSFERFKTVENVIEKISYRNKLNLIIYDGEQMYVHVNMQNTLFFKNFGSGIIFSTVPLDRSGWEPLPLTTLFVYQNGVLKYRGKNHHNEYVDVFGAAASHYDYNI